MKAIGIIGSGQMGAGIAQVSAQAGYHVYLSDVSMDIAERSKEGIAKQLARLVEKEKIEPPRPLSAGSNRSSSWIRWLMRTSSSRRRPSGKR